MNNPAYVSGRKTVGMITGKPAAWFMNSSGYTSRTSTTAPDSNPRSASASTFCAA